ncbi:Abi family protein [Corynebacterium nasicanis]|uniref:Abi family protein n=1 Tax=Corynebacterium nasicanis TaxID=1448267 RepID=A0ABW1QE74_9CORY
MKQKYEKPHLSYEDQLRKLQERGLAVSDGQRGLEVLKRVGYYRLSAYWYPLRVMKPGNKRTTRWNYRFDHFRPGHSLEEVRALYEFDAKLRALTFEALQVIEIAFRAAIAYYAGKEHKYIHLERGMLDKKKCSHVPKNSDKDSYSQWKMQYERQQKRAGGEDFISHHINRYGNRLPIWIATEFLDFGSISMLYSYLPRNIKNEISPGFGVLQGESLASWMRNLNYVRNIIAHHSRLWNKFIVTRLEQPGRAIVDPGLYHLADSSDKDTFSKVYPSLAVIAYILSFIDPENDWRHRMVSLIGEFPTVEGLNPVALMGFPSNWESLGLWKTDVAFINGAAVPPWYR